MSPRSSQLALMAQCGLCRERGFQGCERLSGAEGEARRKGGNGEGGAKIHKGLGTVTLLPQLAFLLQEKKILPEILNQRHFSIL